MLWCTLNDDDACYDDALLYPMMNTMMVMHGFPRRWLYKHNQTLMFNRPCWWSILLEDVMYDDMVKCEINAWLLLEDHSQDVDQCCNIKEWWAEDDQEYWWVVLMSNSDEHMNRWWWTNWQRVMSRGRPTEIDVQRVTWAEIDASRILHLRIGLLRPFLVWS